MICYDLFTMIILGCGMRKHASRNLWIVSCPHVGPSLLSFRWYPCVFRFQNSHISHLNQVLETLSTNGLFLNKANCSFANTKVYFLGHTVGVDGVNDI